MTTVNRPQVAQLLKADFVRPVLVVLVNGGLAALEIAATADFFAAGRRDWAAGYRPNPIKFDDVLIPAVLLIGIGTELLRWRLAAYWNTGIYAFITLYFPALYANALVRGSGFAGEAMVGILFVSIPGFAVAVILAALYGLFRSTFPVDGAVAKRPHG